MGSPKPWVWGDIISFELSILCVPPVTCVLWLLWSIVRINFMGWRSVVVVRWVVNIGSWKRVHYRSQVKQWFQMVKVASVSVRIIIDNVNFWTWLCWWMMNMDFSRSRACRCLRAAVVDNMVRMCWSRTSGNMNMQPRRRPCCDWRMWMVRHCWLTAWVRMMWLMMALMMRYFAFWTTSSGLGTHYSE